mmetsp:Transcript_121383/g.259167  ORF Transcript_121383/g.259167 Transcript_121383/m.259167 type:complete len:89 (+) Transcript_121383:147-413(+)
MGGHVCKQVCKRPHDLGDAQSEKRIEGAVGAEPLDQQSFVDGILAASQEATFQSEVEDLREELQKEEAEVKEAAKRAHYWSKRGLAAA